MDDHNHDDPLDALVRGTRRRAQPDPGAGDDAGGQKGLNPFDLLALPPAQRDLINWLSRHKQARFEELQQALGLDANQLDAVLADLKQAQYIHEALIGGEVVYRVVFRGKVSRAGRSLPDSIWDRIDLDNMVFLRQVPLFANLSESELQEIADMLETRHYRRKEIVLWQGGTGEGIYLIKNGVVAVTRLLDTSRDMQILAYLTQGDLLGEMSLLSEKGSSASATATALSEVEILLMKRQEFRSLLDRYPGVAVELAHMLTQRLQETNTRLTVGEKERTLTLIFGVAPGVGSTTVGMALAMTLKRSTQHAVVYTEYPHAHRLASDLGFAPGLEVFSHPGDFDVVASRTISGLPPTAYVGMVMDRLMKRYNHVIIGVPGSLDDTIRNMLERADQVILVAPPDPATWD
ncbi:MAG: cyclic nucleotide-binding domain-containing protein, partial [Anaerolineae bacterium]|nr:cyclic nucleotide-binding domain-containing protein [Anaerolineae bacterium]